MPGFRDGIASARRTADRFADDKRVEHFYDPYPAHRAGNAFSVASLPDGNVAWDIYMFYRPDLRWDKSLPAPTAMRHQLGRLRESEAFRTGDALRSDLHEIMHEMTGDVCSPLKAND